MNVPSPSSLSPTRVFSAPARRSSGAKEHGARDGPVLGQAQGLLLDRDNGVPVRNAVEGLLKVAQSGQAVSSWTTYSRRSCPLRKSARREPHRRSHRPPIGQWSLVPASLPGVGGAVMTPLKALFCVGVRVAQGCPAVVSPPGAALNRHGAPSKTAARQVLDPWRWTSSARSTRSAAAATARAVVVEFTQPGDTVQVKIFGVGTTSPDGSACHQSTEAFDRHERRCDMPFQIDQVWISWGGVWSDQSGE